MKDNWNNIKLLGYLILASYIIVMTLVLSFSIVEIYVNIDKKIPRENHCLEKELVYYRTIGGILSSNVKTTEQNSDFSKFKCIKWEEEPSFGKALLGQKLVG